MELIKLINARRIIARHSQEKLPFPIAYKFAKFIKLTDDDEFFYHEKLKEIIDRYREKDVEDNTEDIQIASEGILNCKKEISELENTIVELPNIKFDITELGGMMFSIRDIFILNEIFYENEEEL